MRKIQRAERKKKHVVSVLFHIRKERYGTDTLTKTYRGKNKQKIYILNSQTEGPDVVCGELRATLA